MEVLGPGSGSIGFRDAILCKTDLSGARELGSSHERPVQDMFHVKMRDAISQNIIDGGN